MGIGGGIVVITRWAGLAQTSVTRRTLAKQLAAAFVAAVAARVGVPSPPHREVLGSPARNRHAPPPPTPVVSFFHDQPYLDMSGLGEPYEPPQGLRSGRALAQLTEAELRHIAPYV
jgi:hypothetical protein